MRAQVVKKSFNSHIDFSEDLSLLEKIKVPKKYQHTLDKIKTGIFRRSITDAEKNLIDENFKFQLDVFNSPANNSYQKELNNTMKRIAKISGINEIEERLRVLKMMQLLSFDDFESSVKQLNDARKEIGLKIRKLKESTPKNLTQIDELKKDQNKIIELISKAPKRENYQKRKQLLEDRIEKYHKEIYKFCLDFIDVVNEDLTPIKEKNGFYELYLNYDLTLTIQKKEKHKIIVNGKKLTANLKVYKFEQLDKDTKLDILKIIRKNFQKEYLKKI